VVHVLAPPPIDGLGVAGGVKRILEDRGNLGRAELARSTRTLVDAATSSGDLQGVFSSLSADATWLSLEIDRTAAKSLGLSLADVYSTLQICFGSLYINDFNRFGRTWQVNVQADARFRRQVSDLTRLRLRNRHGEMVPLGSVLTVRETTGPALLLRYNLYPAVAVQADAAPGVSSGQALARLEELSRQALVPSMRAEWTEQAFFQQTAGRTAVAALGLAVLLVFLVLAAQYESWSLPLAVILVVPMCLLSSLAGVRWAKLDLNVFTQIGFVVLVGLACKNAILIVEYARARRAAGDGVREALQTACRLRLRPIVMTSLAFLLGVVPLLVGRGAGAEMRYTLGVAVFSGMLGVTLFGLVFTPLFFQAIEWVVGGPARRDETGVGSAEGRSAGRSDTLGEASREAIE
jgi:multidrug efflux pump